MEHRIDNIYIRRFLYFNLYVIKGEDGDILIDTGFIGMKRALKRWLDKFNIKLVILTHAHVDHTWNTAFIKKLYKCKIALSKDDIVNILEENNDFGKTLFYMFKVALRLRNSSSKEQIDQIISPVLNEKGEFFISPERVDESYIFSEYPLDADTNGAYHIALKGLYLLDENFSGLSLEGGKIAKEAYDISNAEWFRYMQRK